MSFDSYLQRYRSGNILEISTINKGVASCARCRAVSHSRPFDEFFNSRSTRNIPVSTDNNRLNIQLAPEVYVVEFLRGEFSNTTELSLYGPSQRSFNISLLVVTK